VNASLTILIHNMYIVDDNFDEFYDVVFTILSKYGAIYKMLVCINVAYYLYGNVYCTFFSESDAAAALKGISGKFYKLNGNIINAELSSVTDLTGAICRQFSLGLCSRGKYCSFIHLMGKSSTHMTRDNVKQISIDQ